MMSGDRHYPSGSFVSTQEKGLSGTSVSSVSSPGKGSEGWLGRLKAIQSEKALGRALTKPTEAPQYGLYRYRFKLRDGGGTYLTPAPTLEQAEAELRHKYGDSLLLVVAGLPVPRPQQ